MLQDNSVAEPDVAAWLYVSGSFGFGLLSFQS